jgi:hypothetical protein
MLLSLGHLNEIVKNIKGTVSQDFLLQIFFLNHLPPSPGVKETGGKQWEQYQTADNLKLT